MARTSPPPVTNTSVAARGIATAEGAGAVWETLKPDRGDTASAKPAPAVAMAMATVCRRLTSGLIAPNLSTDRLVLEVAELE